MTRLGFFRRLSFPSICVVACSVLSAAFLRERVHSPIRSVCIGPFSRAAHHWFREDLPAYRFPIYPELPCVNRSLRFVAGCILVLMGLLAALPAKAQTVTTTIADPCNGFCGISPNGMVVDPGTDQILVGGGGSNSYIWIDGASNLASQGYIPGYASTNGPLAVNPVTHKFYLAASGASDLAVFDSKTGSMSVITKVGVGSALAVNPATNTIYSAMGNTVYVVNGATNTVATTITIESTVFAIVVNPVTNQIYVSEGAGNVTVINGASNAIVTTVNDPHGMYPYALAVNPVTNTVYAANRVNNNNITVINGAANQVVATMTDPTASYPWVLAVNPVTNMVYVTNNNSGTISVFDGSKNSFVTSISPGSYPRQMAIDSIDNKIYVTSQSASNNVTVIDGATNQTVTLTVGFTPGPLALDPVTNKIYVAAFSTGKVAMIDGATNTATTVTDSMATHPIEIAANPLTGQIYVANTDSNNVTVIDASTNSVAATVGTGTGPTAVGVNPFNNTVYVTNGGDDSVTVIDGASNTVTATVKDPNAKNPTAVGVNPVTNTIYVTNEDSANVTVIDGATNTVPATVTDGNASKGLLHSVAVNPVTNQVFVANGSSNNITIIDGATNSVATINDPDANNPLAVAINPVTNFIYVINQGSDTLTVIDGSVLGATSLDLLSGQQPSVIAVNPVTNRVYVGYSTSGSITVINAAKSNTISTITDTSANNATGIAVNPNTNKIYVADRNTNNMMVIDGATNTFTTVSAGTEPDAVAVDPVAGTVYVSNWTSNNVTAVNEQHVSKIPLQASISPVSGNITGLSPTLTFSASSSFGPTAPTPDNLVFAVDTWQGPWQTATFESGDTFSGALATLQPGFHILYAYATDGQEATSTEGSGVESLISNIAAYSFLALSNPVAVPTVTTVAPTSITETSATGGGDVTAAGGATVTGRGVCWGTSVDPDLSGTCAASGSGLGAFTAPITGLTPGSLYHVRAYASNTAGNGYGSDVTFQALAAPLNTIPTVTTTAVSAVTSTTASSGGNVDTDGGTTVTVRGVCWSASANPTIVNSCTNDGAGTGTFTSSITGLVAGLGYHVRAYATNSVGTAYGSDLTFTTTAQTQCLSKPSGLVGWWKADGNGNDSAGANDVTVTPAESSYAAGVIGQAFNFDGTSGFAEKPNPDGTLNVGNQSWTVSAWVQSSYSGANAQTILSRYSCGWDCEMQNSALYELSLSATGQAVFSVRESTSGATEIDVIGTTNLRDGNWHLVTGVLDRTPGNVNTYVDGVLQNSADGSGLGTIDDPSSPLEIGMHFIQGWGTPEFYFNGLVDEAQIYNRALTATEVQGIYSAGSAGVCATAPVLSVIPSSLTFTATLGSPNSAAQAISVANTGMGTLAWTAAKTQSWLNLDSTSGTAPFTINASVNTAGMSIGTYTDTITVTAPGATGSPAQIAVNLVIAQGTPVITWAAPAPITYGTALGSAQLNATANVPGTFAYTPASGTVLGAGSRTLSVIFTPTDATDYITATASVPLTVNQVDCRTDYQRCHAAGPHRQCGCTDCFDRWWPDRVERRRQGRHQGRRSTFGCTCRQGDQGSCFGPGHPPAHLQHRNPSGH